MSVPVKMKTTTAAGDRRRKRYPALVLLFMIVNVDDDHTESQTHQAHARCTATSEVNLPLELVHQLRLYPHLLYGVYIWTTLGAHIILDGALA